jgi:predicted ATPase
VARQKEAELNSSLDRLVAAGLLFRQGVAPHASYLFKHALVQDAAYGTLLREPRRVLHERIAETVEDGFPEIADRQPELLARHYTGAELIERAARFWGKAGERSLARSAVVEASEQLKRALDQIGTLPETSALRREQLKLQISLANALMQIKGYAAPEPKAAFEQARLFMERAEALGEAPEDPLLLFSFLWGVWSGNYVKFNGEAIKKSSGPTLTLVSRV